MELETIIGLEIHAQLNTKSKLFSSADNDAWGAEPNTRINEVDLGFPGVLPVLNREAINKAARAAAALGGVVQAFSKFDRKNYFYPDLPFGYQISQYDQPLSLGGQVDILVDGQEKSIGITRLHVENDAGKLTHTNKETLCDYNRAGSPLIEIVTEPDLRSPAEAQALGKEIQKIVRYVDASDADMEKGMMRFDASISLRPIGDKKLYARTEIKNLNSFTALFKALNYEITRQEKLWETGQVPGKETTVGWLDKEGKTQLLRAKESADDYRYFPEPDLPPVTFSADELKEINASVGELPSEKLKKYQEKYELSEQDALKLAETKKLADFFEETVDLSGTAKKSANFILSVILANTHWQKSFITPEKIAAVLGLLEKSKISNTGAKEILKAAMEVDTPIIDLVEEMGLEQVSDDTAIEAWVDEVLAENVSAIADYQAADEAGKKRVFGFFTGQVMKKSAGSANPPMIQAVLKIKLEE